MKLKMEDNRKITKIVIGKEDELTDIVTGILDSQNERILVTFAEESDLLISPINLKVILETADERDKSIIAQIIKNPTGIRNAQLAGLTTIDNPSYPTEEMWEKEMLDRARRYNPLGKRVEKKEEVTETKEVVEPKNEFKDRINSALEKSRNNQGKEDDILITFDEDIEPLGSEEMPEDEQVNTKVHTKPIVQTGPILEKLKNILQKIKYPTKLKRLIPLLTISVFVLSLLVAFIYYNTVPFVKIRIYVEAKEVSIERTFQGDENIKSVDFENSKIPIKQEIVEKSRSTTITATGTAYRGEKAKGKVNIAYVKVGGCTGVSALNLQAGHVIVSSSSGQSFKLDAATTVDCNNISEAAVTAIEVGEEYNLSSGQHFTVQGFSSNEVYAMNSSGAFTGGSKEQYTVLSQADVNSGVEDLRKIAVEEGEQELKEKNGGWEVIVDSITSELVKSETKTDVNVGAEAKDVNLSIKTKSTATYFLKDGFDEGIANLLTTEAQQKNLFESDKNLELALGDDIEKTITVIESNKNGIKIKLVAKGSVKPKVDKENIVRELKEMSWEEGQEFLKKQVFSAKETEIVFQPQNFPTKLLHFPKRQGGILIEIKEVL